MTTKKARNFEGMSQALRDVLGNSSPSIKDSSQGAFNNAVYEAVPDYNIAESEKVIQGKNNSWIVLGRDRPNSLASGYGGAGHTQAGSIDIVVGRRSSNPREIDEDGQKIVVDPDFYGDAARIHISQRTDIDKNFNLAKGSLGNADAKSGIGIKADHVRVVAREGIKLVTRTDLENSLGGDVRAVGGIDLIAGNDDTELQPIVKGDNLVAAMDQMVFHITRLNGIVDSLLNIQMQFNTVLTSHFHLSPFFGIPTSPSLPVVQAGKQAMLKHFKDTKRSLMTHKANLEFYKASYLVVSGDKWILSRYNNVN